MPIRVINRSLDIPIPDRTVGHIGDNCVEVRTFELSRIYGDIDLAEFDFKLDTQAGEINNIIDLDKNITDDTITLTWAVKESHILTPGRMSIQLRAFSGGEEKWHSAQDYVLVQPSINATEVQPDPLPSEFEQIEQRVTAAKNEAIEAAQEAKQQAERVEDIIQEAEQDVLPELRQAIEDGIETKDQLGGSIQEAGNAKTELDGSITTAEQTKQALDESIATGDLVAFRYDFESHLAESALQINKGVLQSSRNVETLRPLVTFIDDDGSNGVLTKVKPLFTSRNVPIGIAVKGDSPIIIDENKRAEIVELQNDYGWEILSHTMNHMNIAESSREDVENDFKTFITKFSEYGLNVKSIAYPWGRVGDKVDIVSKYFRAGFGTGANTNKRESLRDYNINRYGLGSNMSSGMTTFEQFKTLIDSVKSNNEWLVFMTHADYTDNDMQLIEDVLDYVISQGIEIVTPNEGLRVFGSVVASGNRTVETKYFNIKSEGVIDTNAYILTKTVPTKIEDAPPEINEDSSKGIASINSFKAMNWSVGNGIVVEHLYANGWEYQTFYKSGSRVRIYLRKWDGKNWREWEKVTTSPNNINYTITARTIPAFSSVDVTVYDNTIRASHHHIAQPVGVLEQGITWQCWAHGNQALKIRLTNVTDASIDIAERVWNIARLSTE